MGRTDDADEEARGPLDPITGKPIADSRISSLIIGPEEETKELESETDEVPDRVPTHRERSKRGVQFLGHISDPDDEDEVTALVSALGDQWEQARKDLGLDD